jgi:hypothetical protein
MKPDTYRFITPILIATLMMSGCAGITLPPSGGTTSLGITYLNDAVAGIDGLIAILSITGVIKNPSITAEVNAGEKCISAITPQLQAGGNLGKILGTSLNACFAAATPVIPAGTPANIAQKVTAIGTALSSMLSFFNVSLNPAGHANMARAEEIPWKPTPNDLRILASIKRHEFRRVK